MKPEEILSRRETIERIERICRKRFNDPNEADECFLFVIDGLKKNDYKRLRLFKGRSSLTTYVHALTNTLVVDFQRSKYGRKRIPKIISSLGKWAERIYLIICREGYGLSQAYDIVRIEDGYPKSYPEFVLEAKEAAKAPCPQNPMFNSLENDSPYNPGPVSEAPNPLEALLDLEDHEQRLTAMRIVAEHVQNLPHEDQLMIRLVFGSDHAVAKAGRTIGITGSTAQKRFKKILGGLKAELLAHGIRSLSV